MSLAIKNFIGEICWVVDACFILICYTCTQPLKLQEIYNVIIPIPYAQDKKQDKKEKTYRFIKSIKSMKADYIKQIIFI